MLPFFLLLAALQSPRVLAPPPPQDLTLAPETANTVALLEGRGVQIYTCSAQPAGYAWTLKAPDAQLFNMATGKAVGHHGAGPVWTLDDGTSLHGSVLSKKAGDTPADVPWLLLRAQPTAQTQGTLSPVTYIRRFNTHGGNAPPGGCDALRVGGEVRIPYTATYGFYSVPR